ncbi:hypothetical protein AVEN_130093-1 [Araneus ventricosus]|uniref:Uncharacterized protein n=1 Tax=Araneus ventricosus TaxID=182803 RepID=A0A4Y2ENP0_ARAVE|nr:hypothetical protein AVEN_130093-1 [Araneus ventricosus]
MIIGGITEEKWQIASATQNSTTVEALIDRTSLDAIRNMQHENRSRLSYGSHSSPKLFPSLILKVKSFTNTIQRRMIFEISFVDVETKVTLHLCAIYPLHEEVRQ